MRHGAWSAPGFSISAPGVMLFMGALPKKVRFLRAAQGDDVRDCLNATPKMEQRQWQPGKTGTPCGDDVWSMPGCFVLSSGMGRFKSVEPYQSALFRNSGALQIIRPMAAGKDRRNMGMPVRIGYAVESSHSFDVSAAHGENGGSMPLIPANIAPCSEATGDRTWIRPPQADTRYSDR